MFFSRALCRAALAAAGIVLPCVSFAAPLCQSLDFSGAANRGFADEAGYDGKGGWFDQGPKNDLSGFPVGSVELAGVLFTLLDPAQNGGNSVVLLAGQAFPTLPQNASIRLSAPVTARYLYLLHGEGWMPPKGTRIGSVTFLYADGSRSVQEVVSGRDASDWWNANDIENGVVAWSKMARGGTHGVYVSEFPVEPRPLAAVLFHSEKNALWGLIGATLTDSRAARPAPVPFVTKAGAGWRPFDGTLYALPGSALDFSNLLDAPAGKHGFLTEKDGHFQFENAPGKIVRFHGTNLCYSANFPAKADAPRIAAYLAASGYNAVRFHHYDGMLTENRKNSLDIDWERFDRMEFFMAECEKRGMYIVIDLFSYRKIPEGEIPGVKGDIIAAFKALPPISEAAFANWRSFATAIMTHRNPYTGRTLAEDPALVGLCPVNEDPLGTVWRENASVAAMYDELFAKWKAENNVTPRGWDEEQTAISKFLNGIQLRAEKRYADFLRNELHVRAPLTGANCLVAISLTEPRAQFDYVDNHIYWDHPEFPNSDWHLPYRYMQLSAIEAGIHVPRTLFPSRIAGRPFTVTEWNYCNPNRFRAEGAPLIAAYASLQDWDGLYRFAESHNIENLLKASAGNGFDASTDPVCQLSERVAGLMFLRRDIAKAKGMLTYAVDASNGYRVVSGWSQEGCAEGSEYAGLVTGVSSVWAEGMDPASLSGPVLAPARFASNPGYIPEYADALAALESRGLVPANSFDPAKGLYTSDTGEIAAGVKDGTFAISVPRGIWFISNKPGALSAGGAQVSFDSGPSSAAAVSLDGAPLAESRRILVLHLTESCNSGQSFASASQRLMTDWGKLPHLMRAGRATLSFAHAAKLRAWALDSAGRRLYEVPLTVREGLLTIELDNTRGRSATLAYELAER